MKYIKDRNQFKTVKIITEVASPTNQLYDGTWEDTFIGNFFSFIGRKITNKVKKGNLNRLLNQLQRELEKSQFKTIEQEPIVQQYDVYQSIVILKSYLKNSPNFEKDEFLRELDVAIEHHTEQSQNEEFPTEIREAHAKVLSKMEEVKQFSDSINESVSFDGELILESGENPIDTINDLFHNYMNYPLTKGGTDTLMTVDIGTEGRYLKYRDLIRGKLSEFRKYIEEIPYKDFLDPELTEQISNFHDYIGASGVPERGKMNWDNHGALRASLVKVRKELESISNNLKQTAIKTEDEVDTDEPQVDIEGQDQYRSQMDAKMDEVFDQDQEYKEKMTISEEEMKDLHNSMKTKVEDQKNVVDPISILRIFNRAYNSFSISKDQYDALDSKYSPKIAAKKKSYYELLENTARHTKLFQEWNDGVLALLQQYGEYISKHTKKFIITMLDDNKLFGNRGAQAVLLSKYFDVPLEDAKSKLKTDRPAEHETRITEDELVKFTSVKDIEMNTDKIRRVPFIMEVMVGTSRMLMTVFPLKANKGIGNNPSSIQVKYTSGDDYGFITNYMLDIGVELDTGTLEELGMNGNDETMVKSAEILSDNGFIQKNKEYRITKIHTVVDNKGFEDNRIRVEKIFMLLGSTDEGLYRLPAPNDTMKRAIDDSPNDKLIKL